MVELDGRKDEFERASSSIATVRVESISSTAPSFAVLTQIDSKSLEITKLILLSNVFGVLGVLSGCKRAARVKASRACFTSSMAARCALRIRVGGAPFAIS